VPTNRELAHRDRHPPQAVAAGGKERHVARPEPTLQASLGGDKDFAGDDVHHLVEMVMPVKTPGCAGPSDDNTRAVDAARELTGVRLWRALDDPAGSIGAGSSPTVMGSEKTICMVAPALRRWCRSEISAHQPEGELPECRRTLVAKAARRSAPF
jgi:hypothetical protein